MWCKKKIRLSFWLAVQAVVIALALPGLIAAQDSGQDPGKDKPATQDPSKNSNSPDSTPAAPLSMIWSNSYFEQIGTSGLLLGNHQGIGWGSLYIPSAQVTGLVEQFEATPTQPSSVLTAAVLQATVVYDHRIGTGRIAIQYEPSIAFANGEVIKSFTNQNTNIDILLYSRPRWNVRFSDNFRYFYADQSFGFPYFDVNPVTTGTVTNSFLDGPSRWLSNTAYLSVGYAISARSSISVSPTYVYSESGVGVDLERAASYGGTINWNYRTSERQTFGVMYTGQLIHEALQTTSGATNTFYNTIAGTAGRQLSPTWYIRGALGVTTSDLVTNSRSWSAYGEFSLVKQLTARSSLGINYSRGDTLAEGLISNEYADRIDVTYQDQMSRRFNWGMGGGYLRQVGSGASSGWYTVANAQYLLGPKNGIFGTFQYIHNNQIVNTTNLYNGNRDIFLFGILWQPGRVLK